MPPKDASFHTAPRAPLATRLHRDPSRPTPWPRRSRSKIRVDTRPVVVTMRTPDHDTELAAGFPVDRGIDSPAAATCRRFRPAPAMTPANVMDVFLASGVTVDFAQLTRHVFASSSCGLCGKTSIEAVPPAFFRR